MTICQPAQKCLQNAPAKCLEPCTVSDQPAASLMRLLEAVDCKDASAVEAILQTNRPAVPRSTLYMFAGTLMSFSCPLLRLLKATSSHYWLDGPLSSTQEQAAVRVAELLCAAGYRPAAYEHVYVAEGAWDLPVLMASFEPLKDRPEWFPVLGRSRYVFAALQRHVWTPAAHAAFPAAFQAAARAVLLSARKLVQQAAPPQPLWPQPMDDVQSSCASGSSSSSCSSCSREGVDSSGCGRMGEAAHAGPTPSLGDLPLELLLHVLALAAYPLTAWL